MAFNETNGTLRGMPTENRRIRFATIDGLSREDMPLAAEVWREDFRSEVWATRDMLRVALNLSLLQRLRVLRCRREFLELIGHTSLAGRRLAIKDKPEWLPVPTGCAFEDEPDAKLESATGNAA
jgi:hypothetical protein